MISRTSWPRAKYLLLAVLVVCLAYASRHAQIDDALIYARYIQNALDGHGLVFNPGEKVNGLSSPLYCYVLLAVSWLLHGNIILASVVLSGVFLFLASAVAERMVPFAGFCVASVGYFYVLVGMETALFLFLLVLAVFLAAAGKKNWLPLVLSLLVLTRFEAGIMALLVCWEFHRRRSWPAWQAWLPAAAIGAGYLLLNRAMYGTVLPNSATAKIGQGLSGALGPWPTAFITMARQIDRDFKPTFYFVLAVVVLTWFGFKRFRGTAVNRIAAPFCGLLLAFYVLLNIPGYRWYFAPFIFFALIYAAKGLPETRVARTAAAAVLVAVFTTNLFVVGPYNETPQTNYRKTGEWLARNTPPNATVEAVETGRIGYYSHRYVIDIMGLTTPKNADHVTHGDWRSWLAEDKPDYIVMHMPAMAYESVAVNDPDYEALPFHADTVYLLRRKPGR